MGTYSLLVCQTKIKSHGDTFSVRECQTHWDWHRKDRGWALKKWAPTHLVQFVGPKSNHRVMHLYLYPKHWPCRGTGGCNCTLWFFLVWLDSVSGRCDCTFWSGRVQDRTSYFTSFRPWFTASCLSLTSPFTVLIQKMVCSSFDFYQLLIMGLSHTHTCLPLACVVLCNLDSSFKHCCYRGALFVGHR